MTLRLVDESEHQDAAEIMIERFLFAALVR
jgi:hypothetical protein